MLYFFHGDQISQSRRELAKLHEKFAGPEIISFDGKTVSLSDLKQASESMSLFGGHRLIIVENLFSSRLQKKSNELDTFISFINQLPPQVDLVFWENKEIKKSLLSLLPKKIDLAIFKPDRVIFNFVESVQPGNSIEMLQLFEGAIKHDTSEMVFAMLVRQFRYLIMVKDLGKSVTELSPWQLHKFIRQSGFFTLSDLLFHYRKLLDIDVKIKTGIGAFDLSEEIKLFLINI